MALNHEQEQRFRLKHFPSLVRAAAVGWNKDDPWRLSAVIALVRPVPKADTVPPVQ